MSDQEVEHLVHMANDIAQNLSFNANAEHMIREHLTRFWAPVMREMLAAHVAQGGSGLSDLAMQAVKGMEPA